MKCYLFANSEKIDLNYHFLLRNNFSEKNLFSFTEQNSCLKDFKINSNTPVQLKEDCSHYFQSVLVMFLLSTCTLNSCCTSIVFIFNSSTELGEEGGSCLGQHQDADSLKVCILQYMIKSALQVCKCPVVYFILAQLSF